MFLLVGLGNPGPKYASHRHNVGFMLVDRLASLWGADAWKSKWKGEFSRARVGGEDVVLLKPLTYMNLSGETVTGAMTFFKVPPERVLVAHDELDLPFGELRLKKGGGTAGHNGLKSIVAHVGPEFLRMRIGISRPGPAAGDDAVSGYVLSPFSRGEASDLEPVFDRGKAAAEAVIEHGIDKAMALLHTKTPPRNAPKA